MQRSASNGNDANRVGLLQSIIALRNPLWRHVEQIAMG
jgi:hypothetical protein